MGRIRAFSFGVVGGAGLAYLFDPDRGKARRHMAADRLSGIGRRTGRRLGREGRYRSGQIRGLVERTRHRTPEQVEVDDLTLKARIESEAFGFRHVSGSQVNLTVVDGVAELRGQLPTPDDINRLIEEVRGVPGVHDVRSFLHLPNTPSPNKQEAREAG